MTTEDYELVDLLADWVMGWKRIVTSGIPGCGWMSEMHWWKRPDGDWALTGAWNPLHNLSDAVDLLTALVKDGWTVSLRRFLDFDACGWQIALSDGVQPDIRVRDADLLRALCVAASRTHDPPEPPGDSDGSDGEEKD